MDLHVPPGLAGIKHTFRIDALYTYYRHEIENTLCLPAGVIAEKIAHRGISRKPTVWHDSNYENNTPGGFSCPNTS